MSAARQTRGAVAERELCHLLSDELGKVQFEVGPSTSSKTGQAEHFAMPSEGLAIAQRALQGARDAKHACAHVRRVLGTMALLTSGGVLK